jgi:hypothetical protein
VNNRLIVTLRVVGISLLLLAVCVPGIPILLHRSGFIQGWGGFGFYVFGMLLLPWVVGLGLISLLISVAVKYKNWKSPSAKIIFFPVAATALFVGVYFAPKMFNKVTNSSGIPEELEKASVLSGDERFSKKTLYIQPNLGVITDIEQDKTGRLTVAGRLGAAFVGQNGSLLKSLNFDRCYSDVVLVGLEKNGTHSFLCRGNWNGSTKVLNPEEKTLWTYGDNGSGVDDAAVGNFGNGVKQFVVGFNGGEGIHLVDSAGKTIWRRDDRNVWHVEIVESDERQEPIILHSNDRGQLTIRNESGDVVARFIPEFHLTAFSLTAWGADRRRNKLVASDSESIYIVGLDGKTIVRLPAQIHGDGDPETKGTPLQSSSGASYYVGLQRYELWTRSVLRVYDDQRQSVYEEVLAENCGALQTIAGESGSENILLGCDGKVLQYTLREKAR